MPVTPLPRAVVGEVGDGMGWVKMQCADGYLEHVMLVDTRNDIIIEFF